MDILISVIHIIITLTIGIAFFNMGLSIALCLGSIILIPYLKFTILGSNIPYVYIMSIIYIVSFYIARNRHERKKYSIDFSITSPYVVLFVSLFFLTFIEWDTPWDFQITQLSKNCLKIFTFSFVIWNITNAHPHSLRYMKWLLIASVIIAGTYSIFLMQLEGLNPYTSFLAEYYDAKTDNAEIYSQAISRLSVSSAGKIQATMVHPMTWILHLSLLSVIFVAYLLKTGIKWYGILILFILFNIFISGVRTGIVALGIGFSYFLFKEKKIKIILSICIIIFFIISNNEDLSNIFNSFIDVNGDKSSIYGSSISMRLNQVEGVFQEISGLKLFTGKGYDWSDYYLLNYGTHPTILSFESFVFSALCNSGLIGIGLWLIFFSLLFRLQRKMLSVKTDIHLMDTMIFVYIGYIIGTGDYNYLFPFAIYYTFLMSILKHKIL